MATSKMASRKTYSKYYGNFRGVDFSSDHTNVADSRFAYAVNMYRDYQSGQGVAIETIPGFRRLFDIDKIFAGGQNISTVCGIHKLTINRNGKNEEYCFVHKGENLGIYNYKDYTTPVKVMHDPDSVVMSEHASVSFTANNKLYILDGTNYVSIEYDSDDDKFVLKNVVDNGHVPTVYEGIAPGMGIDEIKKCEVNQINLISNQVKLTFVADGTTTRFDYPITSSKDAPISVKVYGEKVTDFEADKTYVELKTAPLSPQDKTNEEGYAFEAGYAGIEITIEVDIGLTINDKKYTSELIAGCTLFAEFDNRIFLSGNPICPNHIFWCGFNNGYADPTYWGILNYTVDGVGYSPIKGMMTVADALLVLKADTEQDGAVYYHQPKSSDIPIAPTIYPSVQGLNGTGCLGACINFLDDPVFVSKNGLEGIRTLSLMYERNIEHRSSLIDAKLLPLDLSQAKLAECRGYLWLLVGDKIFLADSRQKYTDSTGATQYEWYYLEGMGCWDTSHSEDEYAAYRFAKSLPSFLVDENGKPKTVELKEPFGTKTITATIITAENLRDPIYEDTYDARGMDVHYLRNDLYVPTENLRHYTTKVVYKVYDDENTEKEKSEEVTLHVTNYGISGQPDTFYLLEKQAYKTDRKDVFKQENGNKIFYKANNLFVIDDEVYFTALDGFFKFNFDRRNEDGTFPREAYSFDDRIIRCGVATKMDNCGIPGYTKNTVKKSTVIKTKSLVTSAAKIKVRTNKDPYKQIDRISSGYLDFNNIDFSDFTFAPEGDTLFTVREKEKKWVEKQYYIYSDEYEKPFSLYYIGYDYNVAGRYKEGK